MPKKLKLLVLISLIGLGLVDGGESFRLILIDNIPIKISASKANDGRFIDHSKKDTIVIPLIRVGNLMIIEAQIDTLVGNFILDLGAPYLVLNTTYFRDYEIDNNYTAGTLVSQNDFVRRTQISKLAIQGLEYYQLSADVTDLGAIENKRNIKILGLLGVSLFKNYVFDLNLSEQQLTLYKNFDKDNIASDLILETTIKVKDNVIQIRAQANGMPLNFSIDTGAERNILDNRLPKSVYEGMQILNTSLITDGNGQKSEAILAKINNVYVGNLKIVRSPTIIINLDFMRKAYKSNIDGMLGFPFFALGRVIIDFKRDQLFIYKPNST